LPCGNCIVCFAVHGAIASAPACDKGDSNVRLSGAT
jgi:hypothetical protein